MDEKWWEMIENEKRLSLFDKREYLERSEIKSDFVFVLCLPSFVLLWTVQYDASAKT